MEQTSIKYTTDGKKVVVVGKLNTTDTIVQEVFIINGNEIPSGENFVVKSLHDAPAVSWKESELKKLEARFEKEQREWNNEIDRQRKAFRKRNEELRERLTVAGHVLNEVSPESFQLICDWITGKIKFVVLECWSGKEIIPIENFDDRNEYGLKLMTIFGRKNGNLQFRINQYSDGSGSGTFIYPFYTYEDALEHLKSKILAVEKIGQSDIDCAKKYGFELDREKVSEFYKSQLKSVRENIESYKNLLANQLEAEKILLSNIKD